MLRSRYYQSTTQDENILGAAADPSLIMESILDEMMTDMPDMDVVVASNNAMIEDDNIVDDDDSNKDLQELLEQLVGQQ